MMKRIRNLFAGLFFAGFSVFACFGEETQSAGLYAAGEMRTAEEGFAAEEFRRGVQAYYRGSYNEAVLQFEKALNYMPEDNLILDWLGKAYYHTGLEGTAIQSWSRAGQNGYGGILLQNRIEIVRERRVGSAGDALQDRFTEAGIIPGTVDENMIFSGPVSVLPNNDGTSWVLAYGSNELVLMNVNGNVIDRVTGPVNGFDRPVDLIRLNDGNILISESAGDRLALFSKKGKFLKYIGKKGRGKGEMVGPQYLAQDSRNNIYVSDYGNRRIDVFNKDGEGLFSFGNAQDDFEGLKGPTGVAVCGESVFVADDVTGAVQEFDLAGNFRRMLVQEKTFTHPESMKVWNGFLVICDSNKVISIDSESGSIYQNAVTGNAPARLTSAVPDVNGNILVTDITTNEVYVMTRMQELVGGFFVQIERVNASKFPEVRLEIRVENRNRKPVVGLKENNFYITEDKRPVNKLKFLGAASENKVQDITVIIDRSSDSAQYEEQINTAVREIASSMNGRGTLRIVSAGKIPAVEYTGKPDGCRQFSASALKTPVCEDVPLDLALRLSANDLINGEHKRSVILIGTGKTGLNAFGKYNLAETTAYLNNNHIGVGAVLLTQSAPDEEFEYIISNTPGKEYYIFRPEGLAGVAEELLEDPNGLYVFSYVSTLATNFGEKYLPVEVETYLLNRSGRDECGYFAPLQ